MTRPVLLLRLRPWKGGEWQAAIGKIRAAHPEAPLFLLTVPVAARTAPEGAFDEIWQDGAPRGLFALLALMRRLSWASFEVVYDAESGVRPRLYRLLLRPAPGWERMAN